MLNIRVPLIPAAALSGLVVACSLWLLAGAHPGAAAELRALDERIAGLARPSVRMSAHLDQEIGLAMQAPVFALTTGPHAASDIKVVVTGLAISATRKAALVAVADKSAAWLDLGDTRDDVTLVAVNPNGVTVDTPLGFKSVGLGGDHSAASSDSGNSSTEAK